MPPMPVGAAQRGTCSCLHIRLAMPMARVRARAQVVHLSAYYKMDDKQ